MQHLLQFVFTAKNSNKSIFLQYLCKQLNTLCQNFVYSNLKEKSKTRFSIESLGYNQNAYCRTFLSNFTSEIKSSFLRYRTHFIAKYFQIEYTEVLTNYQKKCQVPWFMYWTYVTKIEKLMKTIKFLRNQKIPRTHTHAYVSLLSCKKQFLLLSGDNPEKIWAHRFFCSWGYGGICKLARGSREMFFFWLFCIKHAKTVIFRVNIR